MRAPREWMGVPSDLLARRELKLYSADTGGAVIFWKSTVVANARPATAAGV